MHDNGSRGFTLTETSIVLGVLAIVLGAVWLVAGTVWNNYKMYRLQHQIVTVVKNIRDFYGASGRSLPGGGAATDMTTTASTNGLLPSDMAGSGGVFRHAFGGGFSLWANAPAAGNVQLRLGNLARNDCIKILMGFPVLAPEVAVRQIGTQANSISINLANIADPSGVGVALPLTTTTANNWCNIAGNTNEVRIAFRIRN